MSNKRFIFLLSLLSACGIALTLAHVAYAAELFGNVSILTFIVNGG